MPEPRKRMEPKRIKKVERKPGKSGMRDYYAGAMADQYTFSTPRKRGLFIGLLVKGAPIETAVEKTGAKPR